MNPPNHYHTLSLPSPTPSSTPAPTQQEIKLAYRRALLTHHPDKTHPLAANGTPTPPHRNGTIAAFSVDQITTAYRILSDPTARALHDRALRLAWPSAQAQHLEPDRRGAWDGDGRNGFNTGLETADLDDLSYDEGRALWFRACRCGQARGFVVTEGELERAEGEGEVVVGCRGCSLWLRVLFGVEEGEEEKKEGTSMGG